MSHTHLCPYCEADAPCALGAQCHDALLVPCPACMVLVQHATPIDDITASLGHVCAALQGTKLTLPELARAMSMACAVIAFLNAQALHLTARLKDLQDEDEPIL